jgi:hypothetical protein
MKKRTDNRSLQLKTQTVRTLTEDALSLIVGGYKSEASYDQGCERRLV